MKIYMILLASFLFRVYLLLFDAFPYWYDEVVFISFSLQPLAMLLDTLTAEPHPPGFFLFLKLFPVAQVFTTRLLLLCISYGIMTGAVLYGYHTKLVQKYKLRFGLSLFISSYTFLETTLYVKDASITVPLSVFATLTVLRIVDKRNKHIAIGELILPYILLTVIFFTSYSSYLFLSIIVFTATFILKRRSTIVFILVHVLIVIVYMVLYGHLQYLGNEGRSIWLMYSANSPVFALQKHIGGFPSYSVLEDTGLVIYAFLLALSVKMAHVLKRQMLQRLVIVLTATLLVVAYALHLFPQLHYSAIALWLTCIVAGWGMTYIHYKRHIIASALIAILFFSGIVAFYNTYTRIDKLYTGLVSGLQKGLREGETVGLVSDFTIMPHVIKNGYFPDDDRLVPMQVANDSALAGGWIGKEHLASDIVVYNSDRSVDQVVERLSVYGQTRIFYLQVYGATHYYDPEGTLFKVLIEACSLNFYEILVTNQFLYEFEDCKFIDNDGS